MGKPQLKPSLTNKSIIYLLIAGVAAVLTGFYLLTEDSVFKGTQGSVVTDRPADTAMATAPVAATTTATADQIVLPEPEVVAYTEEKPILGQFMRVRELRENENGRVDGAIHNLEVVFREGILPQRVFPDNRQVILKYEQITRDMVGDGATAVFFYYEVAAYDTNGDGMLSDLDSISVAVSRPTGWEYRVLASNVDEVLSYEDLPEEEALRLSMRIGGKEVTRVYSLTGK